jgi:hypothetical protein
MKRTLTATLVAAGFLAVSQLCFAQTSAPAADSGQARDTAHATLARYSSGGGGSFGHGGGGFSRGSGSFGHSGMAWGRSSGIHGYSMGQGVMRHGFTGQRLSMRRGGAFGFEHHRHHRFGGFALLGYPYGYSDWYDSGSGSCYWNCRAEGYGPGFCRANAWEYCY